MIRRQHVVRDFFDDAGTLREVLDLCFKDAYRNRIPWQYFCDPRLYTYLRTEPQSVFPKPVFDGFMNRLRVWCIENLGLAPMNLPYLHLMVNGCRLGLHSDFHNGAWGYVYSLTHWEGRRFSGGETLLLRDGVPSYKKHHVHGEILYELIPAHFNQLLVFDDRIVHATPTVEGSMDPMDGRIAMVGHIRATSPVVNGSLEWIDARRVILECLPNLRDRIGSYKDVQGTVSFRLAIAAKGSVESVTILTDNVVTQSAGYDGSDSVDSVKSIMRQTMASLRFPATIDRSTVVVPMLLPLPDLHPIELTVPINGSCEGIREWVATHLRDLGEVEYEEIREGRAYMVREPIAGTIEIEPGQITFAFDPPMWVPSQRQQFQASLIEWAKAAVIGSKH